MRNRIRNRIHKNHAAALFAAVLTLTGVAYAAVPGSQIIEMSTVTVGDAGNAADGTGYGAVSYEYQIGTYEVTNAQYAAFLNAVDSGGANTLSLYNSNMGSDAYGGGITLNSGGADGSKYMVRAGYDLKPVNFVSFYDAMRFTNWLTTGGTETGVYNLLGGGETPTNGTSVTRTLDAIPGTLWALPSEDEWYKAAYYDGNDAGTYRQYPMTGTLVAGTKDNGGTANYNDGDGYAFPDSYLTEVNHYDLVDGANSFYGTYQQGGNVWEWNDAFMYSTNRVLRGGAFYDDAGDLTSPWRASNAPVTENSGYGFRVVALTSLAAVPEPGTYAAATGLLMLIIGMWIRRGHRTGRG
ncbi:MAG: formylglycine-generating enzyme family protein [Opitutaceae bacterium]|jgi:formylglycine-generating enzyme required for sulfatase activity|nr:formylglycine-generating enzyme family protein [Opitutaceae bacterium]